MEFNLNIDRLIKAPHFAAEYCEILVAGDRVGPAEHTCVPINACAKHN